MENSSPKTVGWDEKRVFLEGDKLEVAVKSGRCMLTHLQAAPRAAEPVRRCFPDEE
jgi:hypothetical protein